MKKFISSVLLVGSIIGVTAGVAHADSSSRWQRYLPKASAAISRVEGDMQAAAATGGEETALQVACATWKVDLDDTRGTVTHSPSKGLNRILRQAWATYGQAADLCTTGSFEVAAPLIQNGNALVTQATAKVKALV